MVPVANAAQTAVEIVGSEQWVDVDLAAAAISEGTSRPAVSAARKVSLGRIEQDSLARLAAGYRNEFAGVAVHLVAVALRDHYLQGALAIQVDLAVSPDRQMAMADSISPTK